MAHNPGDLIDGVYLVGGQSGLDYDFGELKPGCISGYVYVDANNNGVFDEGESPIAGVQLALLDAAGNPTGQTRVTDETGFYRFCGLTPGIYGVAEDQPAGYYDGLDAPGTAGGMAHNPGDLIDAIPLASGVKADGLRLRRAAAGQHQRPGLRRPQRQRRRRSGDPLLGGVTIYLLDGSGNRIASTTTDANGKYAFTDLTPGVYGVEEIQPAGYLEGGDRVGSAGGKLDGARPHRRRLVGLGRRRRELRFLGNAAGQNLRLRVPGRAGDRRSSKATRCRTFPRCATASSRPTTRGCPASMLELCDGSGVPLLDAHGNPITTVDRRQRLLRVRHALSGHVFDRGNPAQQLSARHRHGRQQGRTGGQQLRQARSRQSSARWRSIRRAARSCRFRSIRATRPCSTTSAKCWCRSDSAR